MKALLELIARSLVDTPDEVVVEEVDEDGTLVLELTVAREDLGKVIGKQGKTARSIRTILASAGAKTDRRVELEILE
jgi:predicted RNA-binding protein YlqC (UPF0109 family)